MATISVAAGASLQSAINSASPGDTLDLQGNPLSEVITIDKSLVIQGNGFTLDGQHSFPAATHGGNSAATTCNSSQTVEPWTYSPLVEVVSNDVVIDGLNVYRSQGRGISFGDGENSYSNFTYQNAEISYSRANNLWAQFGTNVTIDNVDSHHAGVKLEFARGPSQENWPVSNLFLTCINVQILNSKFHETWGEALAITRNTTGTGGGLIYNCDFWDWYACGIYVHYARDLEIINNRIGYSNSTEFWRSCDRAAPAIWFNNELDFADDEFNPNENVTITGNIIFGTEENIRFGGSQGQALTNSNIEISYNTILDPKTQAAVNIQGNASAAPDYENVTFHNNAFGGAGTILNSGFSSGMTFRDNTWENTPQAVAQGSGDVYNTPLNLSNRLTNIPPGAFPIDPNDYLPNPLSPLVDTGGSGPVPQADMRGTTRNYNGTADRGALELNDGNSAPDVTQSDVTTNINEPVSITLAVTDPDGDAMICTASGLPPGISFEGGVFSGTPTVGGTFTITGQCDDQNGGVDAYSFVWTVESSAGDCAINSLVSNSSGSAVALTIDSVCAGNSTYVITWGDETPPEVTTGTVVSHEYPTTNHAITYTISVELICEPV